MSATRDWTQTKGRARGDKYGCKPDSANLDCHRRGLEGVPGADAVLSMLESSHSGIDVANNYLRNEGIKRILEGVEECKTKFATSANGEWGLDALDVADCNMTDQGMEEVMAYAVREPKLRSLLAGCNPLELKSNIGYIVKTLNASHIGWLNMAGSHHLLSSSVSQLFTLLDAPHLSSLVLSSCSLTSQVAGPLAEYLRSRRSWSLTSLQIGHNEFDLQAVRDIVDAVLSGNFTLRSLRIMPDFARPVFSGNITSGSPDGKLYDDFEVERARIISLLERNEGLVERTRKAALRCLPAARILLNAKFPSHVPPLSSEPTNTVIPSTTSPYFSLPIELQHMVIRHTSGDAGALSNAQFTHLRQYAQGTVGLSKAIRARKAAEKSHRARGSIIQIRSTRSVGGMGGERTCG